MKSSRILLFVTLTVAALVAAPFVRAQDQSTPDQPAPPPHHRRMDRLKMLKHRLGLTDDQVAKIKPIFKQEHTQMEAIHNDDSLSQEQQRAKMRTVFQQTDQSIRALLTPDQIQKLDDMRTHRRPPPADAPAAPPPPDNT